MSKYCTVCGAVMIAASAPGWDEDTGKPKLRHVCSKHLCEHSGHSFVVVKKLTLWEHLTFRPNAKCTVCLKPARIF